MIYPGAAVADVADAAEATRSNAKSIMAVRVFLQASSPIEARRRASVGGVDERERDKEMRKSLK